MDSGIFTRRSMRQNNANCLELIIYFAGAFIAVACNSFAQKILLLRFCPRADAPCRLTIIVVAVIISFCIKFIWDNLLVFKTSKASTTRKGFFFLFSSVLITAVYLLFMSALTIFGVSDRQPNRSRMATFLPRLSDQACPG